MPVPEEPPQRPFASFQTIRPFGWTNSLADGGLGRTRDLHAPSAASPSTTSRSTRTEALPCDTWQMRLTTAATRPVSAPFPATRIV